MSTEIGILACRTLLREMEALVSQMRLSSCEIVPFPCDCSVVSRPNVHLVDMIKEATDRFGHVVIVGRPCFLERDPAAPLPDTVFIIRRGFDLFLPASLIGRLQREGAYIITPGWARPLEGEGRVGVGFRRRRNQELLCGVMRQAASAGYGSLP